MTNEERGGPTGNPNDSTTISSFWLRSAVDRIADALRDIGIGGVQDPTAGEQLFRLARAIENTAGAGEYPEPLPFSVPLGLPLLQRLQTALVEEWAMAPTPPSGEEMLRVLRSIDTVRGWMEPIAESGGAFAAAPPASLVTELAHDLRSPLTSILFLSAALRAGQSGPVNPLQQRQLSIIYSAALGLVNMASDVIELSKETENLGARAPSEFSVLELLQSVCDMLQPLADEKRLSLQITSPAVDRRLGYPVALSRVLLNLTSNALKFTDQGYVEVAVRETGAAGLEFSVRDTGRGLDEDALRHLYEPVRWKASGNRYGFVGSGLGLAISRKLVRALGAELSYETAPGEGTRFYFEIGVPPAGHG